MKLLIYFEYFWAVQLTEKVSSTEIIGKINSDNDMLQARFDRNRVSSDNVLVQIKSLVDIRFY